MTASAQTAHPPGSSQITVPWSRVENFVGQLTHDVRNGLNALELQLTFLAEISNDPEAVAEVKLIRGTLSDITRQLQAIRQATGSVTVHKLDYPAAEFYEDLRERFERKESAAKDQVKWEVDVADHLLALDPEASLTVFLELLANALRFGDAAGVVTFAASVQPQGSQVKISHSLPQPPTLDLSQWGATPLLSTQRGAYGLGLFRARRILEAQGGSLEAEYSDSERLLVTKVALPLSAKP